jgi:hypothetical protein
LGKNLLSLTKYDPISRTAILGIQANEICRIYGNNERSFLSVTWWYNIFKNGVDSVKVATNARFRKLQLRQKLLKK